MNSLLLLLALAANPAPASQTIDAGMSVSPDGGTAVETEAEDDDEEAAEAARAKEDAAALARLTPDQLAQVLLARERSKNGGTVAWLSSLAFFVVTLGVALGLLVAYVKIARSKQETLRAAIQAGTLPASALDPRRADLRRGILFISTGVGVALVLLALAPAPAYSTAGLLPALIGAGYFVAARWARPK